MSKANREQERLAFVKKTHWAKADMQLLAGDASFRKYYRLFPAEQMFGMPSAVLMDAPPDKEDIKPFIAIADRLKILGYASPTIIAQNIPKGFLLLEDFGDDSFNHVIDAMPARENELYSAAVDVLVDLHSRGILNPLPISPRKKHKVLPYSHAILMEEVRLLPQWTLRALLGEDAERDSAFDGVWQRPLAMLQKDPSVLVLRDYHADNLMWLPTRVNLERVGLLDFQDALLGHPAYDLVSLLQDVRRVVPPALEERMIARYIHGRTAQGYDLDEENFRAAYAILGAQRNVKIIGIFTRLYLRDGKPEYLNFIPRIWGLIERNLWHESLKPLKDWMQTHISQSLRKKTLKPQDFKEVE